jgi:hypothetical protein
MDKKNDVVKAVMKPNKKLWKTKANIKDKSGNSNKKTMNDVSIAMLMYS